MKLELSYDFTINLFTTAESCMEKCFSCPSKYSRQLVFIVNADVLIVKMLKISVCFHPQKRYFQENLNNIGQIKGLKD